ncbi:MAG: hypothetical protein HYW49_07525 [Deltaproteobacteria bacterium]|nr:hypothetical protein [Deltaproteobacteria bacterium]
MKRFSRITISGPEILEYPAARRILENLRRYDLLPYDYAKPEIIDAAAESQRLAFKAPRMAAPRNHAVALGKEVLHLTTHAGAFTKQCPGTNHMLCCQYHVINMVSNCPFDCSYCYLQTYLNQPMTTFYVNEDDVISQVRELCARHEAALATGLAGVSAAGAAGRAAVAGAATSKAAKRPLRIGTGELSDSLALDPITGFSSRLAEALAEFPNVRLELKTKSKNVEHLMGLSRKDHVVIGWSMNPPAIIDAEEHGTARFSERVRAAALAAEAGFGIAFHFDPMIHAEGWQDLYRDSVKTLLERVPHEAIRWVSIGGLRYQPRLKSIALKRRSNTPLFAEDSVTGEDGKVRYLRGKRTEMFQFMNKCFGELAPGVYTYLCMESVPVWEKALGRMPERGF